MGNQSPLPRRGERKRVSYPCEVLCEGERSFHEGRVDNLTTSGAYVETPKPCPKGTAVTLRFCIGAVAIKTKAEVIHQTPGVGGMGVRFLDLDPAALAAIESVVQENSE